MIPRRAFVGSLGLGVLAVHRHAYAQASAKIPQVGYFGRSAPNPFVDAFRMALHDLGYVEGETIVITTRWTEGKLERLPALAAELVRLKVDVIVASGTPAALAAKQATGVIPIVMIGGDPILSGLVDSLARPGRNITGLTLVLPEVDGKRLELLKEVVPAFSRVATLLPTGNRAALFRLQETRRAAQKLGVSLQVVEVTSAFDFESAFDVMKKERADALLVSAFFGLTETHQRAIVELAAKRRMPTLYDTREFVEAGGLMAYGPSLVEAYRRAALYVHKILKGAKPAELPMEQPTKFDMAINLKTARALGLTIPPSLLVRAEHVIE